MPYAKNGEVNLYYEVYGPDDGPTLLMIEGYTAQLVGWEKGFVGKLNERGIRTVLLDNRDVGLSGQLGTPHETGKRYDISDMANDVVAVAKASGAERFHIMGESMGGMIAQQIITNYPESVKSATIMFTTPDYRDPQWMSSAESSDSGSNEGLEEAETRAEAIEMFVSRERACHVGSSYAFDESWARELGGITYDRCYRTDGWRRQKAAIEDFSISQRQLARFTRPVALIHGKKDPFFSPKSAMRLSELLDDSELHIYPGMAHEIPRPLWDDFADIAARTITRGE